PGHQGIASVVTEEATALMKLGEVGLAMDVIRRYHEASGSDPAVAERIDLLLAESAVLASGQASEEQAAECLGVARKILYEEVTGPTGEISGPELRRMREDLMLAEAEVAGFAGTYPELAESLSRILDGAEYHSVEFRLLAGSWLCEAWALTGRQADATTLADQLKQQCTRPDIPLATAQTALSRLICAYMVAGQWDDATDALSNDDRAPVEDIHRRFTATEVPEALSACMQGRGRDGLDLLVPGISQLRIHDTHGVLPLACAAAAYAAALQGDEAHAFAYLAEAESTSTSRRKTWTISTAGRYFTALARAQLEGPQAAIGQLLSLADEDRVSGTVGHELICLSSIVRLGDAALAPRLLATAAQCQGPFADLCSRFAGGVMSGSPMELMAAANLAARLHNDRFALDIAEAVLNLDQGQLERSLIRQAKHLAESSRRRLRAPQDGLHDRLTLTARELQIAQLAASGASNKNIAAQLHVSVRTVEGHLYQIYGKLKIEERLELPVALGSSGDDSDD
ncbi:MAG: helix-turn-helix transcriptional regulator, partial [Arthrobacter sp.]